MYLSYFAIILLQFQSFEMQYLAFIVIHVCMCVHGFVVFVVVVDFFFLVCV